MKRNSAISLVCAVISIFAAPLARGQATHTHTIPKPVQQLIDSLPPSSEWQDMLHRVWGDGIRRPWMDDMQRHGVKLAIFSFDFNFRWKKMVDTLTNWKLDSVQYFADYDQEQPIASPADLESLKRSGLGGELATVALRRAKRGIWFERPRQRTGTGYRIVYLAESEWLPVQLAPYYGRYVRGTTPLMRAALLGDLARVKRLVADGSDVNASIRQGDTPLIYAVFTGSSQIVRYLLSHGAAVNANPGGHGDALLVALRDHHMEIAKILLEAGADPNSRDREGNTALSYALQDRDAGLIELLKQAGARN